LERNLGPEHPDVIIITIGLGELYSEQNRIAEAESLFRRALKSEKVLRHNPLKIAQALEDLGKLYFTQTKYAEAEPLFSGALAIKEKELGATHINLVPTLNYLGGIRIAKGKLADAEPLIKRALKITEKEGGNYDLVVGALNLYAGVLRKMGRNEEASIFEKRADKIKSNQGNQN
jgi:tetratricopeptide (TPR) repeat protein